MHLRFAGLRYVEVPCTKSLPENLRIIDFFGFYGTPVPAVLEEKKERRCGSLDNDEKAEIILEIIKAMNTDIVVFNNFTTNLSGDGIDYYKETLDILIQKEQRVTIFCKSGVDILPLSIESKRLDKNNKPK